MLVYLVITTPLRGNGEMYHFVDDEPAHQMPTLVGEAVAHHTG